MFEDQNLGNDILEALTQTETLSDKTLLISGAEILKSANRISSNPICYQITYQMTKSNFH